MKIAIVLHLVALLASTLAFPYTAQQYRTFQGICSDLLDLSPYYRQQLNERHVFPDDPIGHRFIYCMGVLVKAHDPVTVAIDTDRVYVQFGQGATLSQFRKRVDQCESRAKMAAEDRFELAYHIFKCFEESYVKILHEATVGVADVMEYERICMEVLDVSSTSRKLFGKQQYPDNEESRKHIYCAAVLGGFYSDREGLNMSKVYQVLGKGEDKEAFEERAEACFDRVSVFEKGISKFEKIYRIYKCFADDWKEVVENEN